MRYVIGDVHGCFQEMQQLIRRIEEKDRYARFIFVGDFIDRGPAVMETLEWAMKHVTKSGKYRSVLGNHEQMVIDWFQAYQQWYADPQAFYGYMPQPTYDFLERLQERGLYEPEKIRPYIDFMKTLPYQITAHVRGAGGGRVTYDIVHAWVPPDGSGPEESDTYIWERVRNETGNDENDHVIIHGHTPTPLERRNKSRKYDIPGMITYRKQAVNLDGGCVFAPSEPQVPCMLCAICLETLEEIYSDTIRGRLAGRTGAAEERIEHYETKYARRDQNPFRQEILQRLRHSGDEAGKGLDGRCAGLF